jgi:glycosyltransferase involved in cell wall biosynthesis
MNKATNPLIEITIPVLDEAQTIEVQVRKIRYCIANELAHLGAVGLVLADNGSTDGTSEIAARLEAELEGVRHMRLEQRGVGRALKASWSSSTASVVGYMDLDLATDLKHLNDALTALLTDTADVVTGSRLAKGAVVRGRTLKREITSRIFNTLVQRYFGTSFTDGMCGFKFLRRESFPRLLAAGADNNGWFFATELLIAADYLGLRTLDLPVEWTDDPNSKVRIARLSVEYLKAMRALKGRLPARKVKN